MVFKETSMAMKKGQGRMRGFICLVSNNIPDFNYSGIDVWERK